MMDPAARLDCLKEVKALQALQHPHIVACLASFLQARCAELGLCGLGVKGFVPGCGCSVQGRQFRPWVFRSGRDRQFVPRRPVFEGLHSVCKPVASPDLLDLGRAL
jgi:hypothetical protein